MLSWKVILSRMLMNYDGNYLKRLGQNFSLLKKCFYSSSNLVDWINICAKLVAQPKSLYIQNCPKKFIELYCAHACTTPSAQFITFQLVTINIWTEVVYVRNLISIFIFLDFYEDLLKRFTEIFHHRLFYSYYRLVLVVI